MSEGGKLSLGNSVRTTLKQSKTVRLSPCLEQSNELQFETKRIGDLGLNQGSPTYGPQNHFINNEKITYLQNVC